ncbi:hypothetical protein CLA01_42110 [Chryseobacterium lathyri]|jgi:hypothetical protein|uniref:Uncharacterized protein n=1 Tax=Chryseobacterium lathyri TaxID=395933 RepID=A0A511YG27_9FLAO|nr:hypothetical protein CLA01_42110 [Chryseobacterium lathyri]
MIDRNSLNLIGTISISPTFRVCLNFKQVLNVFKNLIYIYLKFIHVRKFRILSFFGSAYHHAYYAGEKN